MKQMLTTKEVSKFLNVNEKMIYSLISDKKLPATKVTGKWLFPKNLVEQWIESNTVNQLGIVQPLPPYHGLLIISGSNDPLLEKTISLFNNCFPDHNAVFGSTGSMGGLKALKNKLCHMASCHLFSENENDYNFDFAIKELGEMPAVVNFCRREQGLIIQKGNPKKIESISDLIKPGIKIANRSKGTGTRLLFDQELKKVGIKGESIKGYDMEFNSHLEIGIEILSERADAALGIKAVASLFNIDFIPFRWERYDLLVSKENFFEKAIQLFIGLLHEDEFKKIFNKSHGYDLGYSGKMVYPV